MKATSRWPGHPLARSAFAALPHIGVVFQQFALDLDRGTRRNMLFIAYLNGLPRVWLMLSARIRQLEALPTR